MDTQAIENVDVYYNLHKRLWSCKCRATGRVIRHAYALMTAYDARLVVRKDGREKVLTEGVKNVHAFARIGQGETAHAIAGWEVFAKTLPNTVRVSYNPYKAGHFYNVATGDAVRDVKSLIMTAPHGAAPQVWAVI